MMTDRLAEARARETRFLNSFDLTKLNGRLIILLSGFVALNFLDELTTLTALYLGPQFVELNPIAAGLFQLSFNGFILALGLKYLPMIPFAYVTFLPVKDESRLAIRVVKVSALVALVAADLFYMAVVGSNVYTLATFYGASGH
jgi:Domain of unknown function (DUF5658)